MVNQDKINKRFIRHITLDKGIQQGETHHITKHGQVKKNPIGKKISEKRFDYMYEVLPPLLINLRDVVLFLKTKDNNPELIAKIKKAKPIEGFMQGEGFDRHDIYIQTKRGFYIVGKTKKVWNTEIFRYNDWSKMTDAEIRRYNME